MEKQEVFTVEDSGDDGFQSVFPSHLSEYSQLHGTEQDAWDYIKEIKKQLGL